MIVENLVQLGFTENEAKVYLMLLRIGPSPVSSLARRVGMKRVTVYSVLDSLRTRGLVTFEQTGSFRKYIPHDPECLLFGLEKQSAELKYRMGLAKACIEGMYQNSSGDVLSDNRICFFSGIDTAFDALEERVDEESTLFVLFPKFGEVDPVSKRLEKFLLCRGDGKSSLKISVSSDYQNVARKIFSGAMCKGVDLNSSTNAALLVQRDKMFFLISDQSGDRMVCFNNPACARFFCEILSPICFS